MTARRPNPLLLVVLLTIASFAVACSGGSGPLGSVPAVSGSPEPSVAQGSPDVDPGAVRRRELRAPTRRAVRGAHDDRRRLPSPSSTPCRDDDRPRLLLARRRPGQRRPRRDAPRGARHEGRRDRRRSTRCWPARPRLESHNAIIDRDPGRHAAPRPVDRGWRVATVNLSSEFDSGGDANAVQTRIGQVVYTLTQFPSVKSVVVQVEGVDPAKGLGRADFVSLLPDIWVDRPGVERRDRQPGPRHRLGRRLRGDVPDLDRRRRPARSSPTSRRWRPAAAAAAGRSTPRSPTPSRAASTGRSASTTRPRRTARRSRSATTGSG